MTLLFCDGFDLTTWDKTTVPLIRGWISNGFGNATATASVFTGRFGSGNSLGISKGNANGGTTGMVYPIGFNRSTLIAGCAFSGGFTAGNVERIIGFLDNGTEQLSVRLVYGSTLSISRNGTTLATQTTSSIANGTFYFVELRATFGTGTSGSYALRVDGNVVPGIPDATGVNTSATGNAFANQLAVLGVSGAINPGNNFYDDLYLLDNNGSVNNDILGDLRVIGLLPTGNGANSGFTRVGGTASGNYTAVQDTTLDFDTSYVFSPTINTIDTYAFQDLPATASSVLAVVSEPVARRDDAGSKSITARIRDVSTTEADGPGSFVMLSTYTTGKQVMETNPVTSTTWTVSDVNNSEFGQRVVT